MELWNKLSLNTVLLLIDINWGKFCHLSNLGSAIYILCDLEQIP